jgi:hypothetical protein
LPKNLNALDFFAYLASFRNFHIRISAAQVGLFSHFPFFIGGRSPDVRIRNFPLFSCRFFVAQASACVFWDVEPATGFVPGSSSFIASQNWKILYFQALGGFVYVKSHSSAMLRNASGAAEAPHHQDDSRFSPPADRRPSRARLNQQ